MGFKQKGFSTHSGTSSHSSALKAHIEGHKPKMSNKSAHGSLGDAQADFKADQENYKKAMADKPKNMDQLHEEGFDPNEALQMQKNGATTGGQDAPPTKFLGIGGDKEGRAKRKEMRKEAKPKRRAAKKVTKSENKKIKSDGKTAKLASKLDKRQVKAETNVTEKKENKAKKTSKFKGSLNDGISKVNKFLYGDKSENKAATEGTNAQIVNKSEKRRSFKEKMNKGLHDYNEGVNAVLHGKSMKEYKPDSSSNKLNAKSHQNSTLGVKSGNASKSKTSKNAAMKTDGEYDTVKQNMAKTQTKMDDKASAKKAKETGKKLESNPLYKQNKGVKKGGGSYDKYFKK